MKDVYFEDLERSIGHDIGFWLEEHMPNPPLPETQRWTLGYSDDGRCGIRFMNDEDATHFMLRWS